MLKIVGFLPWKVSSFVWPVNDSLVLKVAAMYYISSVHVGWNTVDQLTVLLKPREMVSSAYRNKADVAGYNMSLGHSIHLQDSSIMMNKSKHMNWIIG
jgi:hypothetical protein